MPTGLKIAVKDGSIHDNRYERIDVPTYKPNKVKKDIDLLKRKHQDSLLSFMKPPTHRKKVMID